jgi:hypothetical protein
VQRRAEMADIEHSGIGRAATGWSYRGSRFRRGARCGVCLARQVGGGRVWPADADLWIACQAVNRAVCASLPTIPSAASPDQARDDFAAILDELEFVKEQLARLPTRAYVSRMALMATCSLSALIAAVALLLMR